MAKKDKPVDEKVFTIPLRRTWVKQTRVKRAPTSIRTVQAYVEKHTAASEVKLSAGVNEFVWQSGAKKPPGKVKVNVRLEEGVAFARLPEEKLPQKEGKVEAKKEETKAPEKKETEKKEQKTPEGKKPAEKKEEPRKEKKDLTPEQEAEQLWKEAEKEVKK